MSDTGCHHREGLGSYACAMEPSRGENRLAGLEALERRGGAAPMPERAATWTEPAGPAVSRRASRNQATIRTTGPFVALIPPAALGLLGWWLLRSSTSGGRGLAGFAATVLAAPLLPAWGVPLKSGGGRYLTAAAASAILWLLLGVVAAVRSTRDPQVRWYQFWAQYLWYAVCAWAGVALSLVAVNLVLGRVLV